MNGFKIFTVATALSCLALFPVAARADDELDDLDVTMDVFDDEFEFDNSMTTMRGPEDVDDDDWEDDESDDENESESENDDYSEDEFEDESEEEDDGFDRDDDEYEEEEMDEEDDFEDEEDIDEDEFDDDEDDDDDRHGRRRRLIYADLDRIGGDFYAPRHVFRRGEPVVLQLYITQATSRAPQQCTNPPRMPS